MLTLPCAFDVECCEHPGDKLSAGMLGKLAELPSAGGLGCCQTGAAHLHCTQGSPRTVTTHHNQGFWGLRGDSGPDI